MQAKKRPYKLPEPMTINSATVENGVSIEVVEEYIRYHEAQGRRYEYLGNLYKGFHDIFNLPEKEAWKPDNRLAVNFPKYITDTFVGYGYGIPIKVNSPEQAIDDIIQEYEKDNEMNDERAELVKKICQYGHAWEYFYQDEETKTKVSAMSPREFFCVYDDTIKQRGVFAVRYGYHKVDGRRVAYGEVMTQTTLRCFDDGKYVEADRENPYGMLPCVEWRMNDERMGLYEGVAGLVEQFNNALGEKANDVDAFAEAYLAILGAEIDEEGVKRIRDDRIINIYGTDNAKDILVQFLSKPTADASQENLLDRLSKLIFQISMVADISDESFGSATSGEALAYKVQAMSNLASTVDRKIEKSIRKHYKIFCSLGTNVPDTEAYRDIKITFSRNLPKNLKEEAEIAASLAGVVSHETQLSVLSIVDDVHAELERIDDEREQLMVTDNMFQPIGEEDERLLEE